MPIYEYRCDDCGHELEKLQRMSDEPLRDCPACGAPSLRRLVSAAGFRLKGSGWYETDFKKDNQRNLAGDGKPPEKKGGDGSDSKSADKGKDGGGKAASAKASDSGGQGGKATSGGNATGGGSKSSGDSKGSAASA